MQSNKSANKFLSMSNFHNQAIYAIVDIKLHRKYHNIFSAVKFSSPTLRKSKSIDHTIFYHTFTLNLHSHAVKVNVNAHDLRENALKTTNSTHRHKIFFTIVIFISFFFSCAACCLFVSSEWKCIYTQVYTEYNKHTVIDVCVSSIFM